MRSIDSEWLARARGVAEVISPLAREIETKRRLPATAVETLVRAGIFKLAVPRALGGSEAPLPTLLAVLEELARADGSAGWCAMIGATSGVMSVYLDDHMAREVYGPADAITCGVLAPLGRAVRARDGLRVSGRWPFASGCEHSQWRMGGVLLFDGDKPELLPNGAPHIYSVMFRAEETSIVETWDTSGLRGTGSHDLQVTDFVVPEARCFSLFTGVPRSDAALYRLPLMGVLAAGVASVLLGIGRAAVDAFVPLAAAKQPLGAQRTLAHRETIQLDLARAEAKLRAARALLHEAASPDGDGNHGAASLNARVALRLAACHAAGEAAAAVDLLYHAAGASSIYSSNPLQRHFRDVHVGTQHAMVGPTVTTLVGRMLLGLDTDVTRL